MYIKKKVKKIVQYGNPVLETKSKEVSNFDEENVKALVDDMLLVLNNHEDTGAGLSAPQIGVSKRVAICRRLDIEDRRSDDKKNPIWEVMINPEIVEKSKVTSTEWEGCLSINNGNLFGKVTRPANIKVKYLDLEGKSKSLDATGYFSHVVQHEIDHLDGVLFIKYIKDPTELYTIEELKE